MEGMGSRIGLQFPDGGSIHTASDLDRDLAFFHGYQLTEQLFSCHTAVLLAGGQDCGNPQALRLLEGLVRVPADVEGPVQGHRHIPCVLHQFLHLFHI